MRRPLAHKGDPTAAVDRLGRIVETDHRLNSPIAYLNLELARV
jgi:hypothetical protein